MNFDIKSNLMWIIQYEIIIRDIYVNKPSTKIQFSKHENEFMSALNFL
jgi:hypothetical protein